MLNVGDTPKARPPGPTDGNPFPNIAVNHDTCQVGKQVKQEVNSNLSPTSHWRDHGLTEQILRVPNASVRSFSDNERGLFYRPRFFVVLFFVCRNLLLLPDDGNCSDITKGFLFDLRRLNSHCVITNYIDEHMATMEMVEIVDDLDTDLRSTGVLL